MKGLTQSFLENLAEAASFLSREAGGSLHPSTTMLVALVLTGTAAFSRELILPLLLLALAFLTVLLVKGPLASWLRVVAMVSLWALIVSAPLPFLYLGNPLTLTVYGFTFRVGGEGISEMVHFTVRVASAAAVFSAFILSTGWRRLMEGLKVLGVPGEITSSLTLSLIYLPIFLRETVKMLSAREARMLRRNGIWEKWGVLSTVIGDLLLRSHERAWRLEKAVRARSLNLGNPFREVSSLRLGPADLSLIAVCCFIPVLGVLAGL